MYSHVDKPDKLVLLHCCKKKVIGVPWGWRQALFIGFASHLWNSEQTTSVLSHKKSVLSLFNRKGQISHRYSRIVTTRDVYSLYYSDFQLLLPLFWSCCKCQPWSYHLWKKWLSVGVNYHFVFVSNFLFLYPFTQYFCKAFQFDVGACLHITDVCHAKVA